MNLCNQINNFCGQLNQYVPLILAGSATLFRCAQNISEWMTVKHLSNPDQDIQKIFQEIVCECGLDETGFICKIYDGYDTPARAIGYYVVAISQGTADQLKDTNQKLVAREIIKHELGHLVHKDLPLRVLSSAAATGILFGLSKISQHYMPKPHSSLGALAFAVGALFATYVQLRFMWNGQIFALNLEEKRADAFAIQHSSNPEELLAMADYFSNRFESHVEKLTILQIGGQRISDLYEQRKDKSQSMRDWAIENRHTPYVAGESRVHPNLYDRSMTFRLSAEQLKKNKLSDEINLIKRS